MTSQATAGGAVVVVEALPSVSCRFWGLWTPHMSAGLRLEALLLAATHVVRPIVGGSCWADIAIWTWSGSRDRGRGRKQDARRSIALLHDRYNSINTWRDLEAVLRSRGNVIATEARYLISQ